MPLPRLSGKPYCYYHVRLHQFTSSVGLPQRSSPCPRSRMPGASRLPSLRLSCPNSPYFEPRRFRPALLWAPDRHPAPQTHRSAQTGRNRPHPLLTSQARPLTSILRPHLNQAPRSAPPTKPSAEPPRDCRNCSRQDTCSRYEEPSDDDEQDEEERKKTTTTKAKKGKKRTPTKKRAMTTTLKNICTMTRSIAGSSEPYDAANSSVMPPAPQRTRQALETRIVKARSVRARVYSCRQDEKHVGL